MGIKNKKHKKYYGIKAHFLLIFLAFLPEYLLFSSFHQISWSTYIIDIQASDDIVSVNVPENVTGDVAGNKNLGSNVLQVRHRKSFFVFFFA